MITGTVKGQSLRLSAPVIAADTINYLTARFLFSEDWDGLMIFAHFNCGNANYDAPLINGELLEDSHINLGAGTWSVWLHGEGYSDGKLVKRITTIQALLIVKPTGTFDGEPFPATPSEIERLHAEFDALKRGVQADLGENDETAASYVKNRPFTALGDGLEVDENGVLSAKGGVELSQKAAVGEVLTVEEIDENGKPTKWKTAPAAAKQVQADWQENDETSPSFVKNRPFYAETLEQVVGSGFEGWNLTAGARDDGIISKVKINDVIYENISPLGNPSYSFVSYNIGEWEITFLRNYQRVSISPSTISDSDILFLDVATTYHAIPEEYIPALSDIRTDIGLMQNHMYFGSSFEGRTNATSVNLSNVSRAQFILLTQTGRRFDKLKYTSVTPDGVNYYDIISSKTGVKITEDEIPYGVMALYHNSFDYICINPI